MIEKSVSKWGLKRVFRITGKFLLILLCFIISILLISVIAVQFKSVRQFALSKLLNTVTSRTNSIITAEDLHFYFTGNVDLDGLFVGDEKSDTIIFFVDDNSKSRTGAGRVCPGIRSCAL